MGVDFDRLTAIHLTRANLENMKFFRSRFQMVCHCHGQDMIEVIPNSPRREEKLCTRNEDKYAALVWI